MVLQSVVVPAMLAVGELAIVTAWLAVVVEPHAFAAVAITVKLPVMLLTTPVLAFILAPVPFKILYVMLLELVAVAV
jgi:hypothetical protein